MKMKKLVQGIVGVGVGCVVAGSAMAGSSSKFAATYSTDAGLSSVVVTGGGAEPAYVAYDMREVHDHGYTLATIKVPQDKELLVGVSAEIGIVTYGSVKGKNGGSGTAKADGNAQVTVFAIPTDTTVDHSDPTTQGKSAHPGTIMLSRRIQELSATLGGVIESCTDTSGEGTITIATECTVTDEEIGLLLDTTAAHHFNFVLPNMNQGVYDIKAVFTTGARAEVDICDAGEACSYDPDGTVTGSAEAKAIINKTMLTVQQVRAAKDGLQETDIIEP